MRLKYSQNYSDHHLMLLQNKDRTIVTIPSRLLVRAVPASRRALVMFLDSVPGPSEQRSVLPTLRNPTCKEQCLPVSPASQLYFAWQSIRCGQRSGFQHISTGPSTVWRPDAVGLDPGVEPQLQPRAASRTDGWKSEVESGCQIVLRWKIQAARSDSRRERRTRTKGLKGSTRCGDKEVHQSCQTPHPSLIRHGALKLQTWTLFGLLCSFGVFFL